jgi:hypothetical protein
MGPFRVMTEIGGKVTLDSIKYSVSDLRDYTIQNHTSSC